MTSEVAKSSPRRAGHSSGTSSLPSGKQTSCGRAGSGLGERAHSFPKPHGNNRAHEPKLGTTTGCRKATVVKTAQLGGKFLVGIGIWAHFPEGTVLLTQHFPREGWYPAVPVIPSSEGETCHSHDIPVNFHFSSQNHRLTE